MENNDELEPRAPSTGPGNAPGEGTQVPSSSSDPNVQPPNSLVTGADDSHIDPKIGPGDSSEPAPGTLNSGAPVGMAFQRIGVGLLLAGLVFYLAYLGWQRFRPAPAPDELLTQAGQGGPLIGGAELDPNLSLPPLAPTLPAWEGGIARRVELDTVIPSRARVSVITYTVQTGDNLFSIAEKYDIKPETVLWGNYEILKDNPQLLSIDQVLNILPTNGVYYEWKEGDKLNQVAATFEVDSQAIISYPGNQIDLTAVNSETVGLQPGTWVIVPGGKRPLKDWGPPAISRSNPASAAYYGPGHCGSVYEGPIGYGTFVWPTTERFISGYNYSAIHRGIDIGGSVGNAIFATDSGVVVYAGWSNYGYGNLIVVDHGNGWQSAYAHLSSISVRCGQGVGQGTVIGGLGSTGNSTGPHLHFELVYSGTKPNPLDFLP